MEIIEEKVKRFWIVESNWSYNKYQIKHNRPGIKTLDEKRYTSTKIYKVIFTKEELETFEAEWRNKMEQIRIREIKKYIRQIHLMNVKI